MSLCLAVAGKVTMLAATAFTLAWTHTVERIAWEEDWRWTPAGLVMAEARIKGSGAGMEPPHGAWLHDDWWHYTPNIPPQRELVLARSAEAGGWRLCSGDDCLAIEGSAEANPARIYQCQQGPAAR